MYLSDTEIRKAIRAGQIKFRPYLRSDQIEGVTANLRLGPNFLMYRRSDQTVLDLRRPVTEDMVDRYRLEGREQFVLHPRTFVLAATIEQVFLGPDLSIDIQGKSTLARVGLIVETAGVVSPGFKGPITLEISNLGELAITLHPGMYICQLRIVPVQGKVEKIYHGTYSNRRGPGLPNTLRLFPRWTKRR